MTNNGATSLLPGLPSVGDVTRLGRVRFAPDGSQGFSALGISLPRGRRGIATSGHQFVSVAWQ